MEVRHAIHDLGARVLPDENLHVTALFLGDGDWQIEKIAREVLRVARAAAPFTLQMHELGGFPRREAARSVVLLAEPEARFDALVQALGAAVGVAPDRTPRPHVTVGRSRATVQVPRLRLTHELRCAELALYESHLLPSGASYQVRQVFPLVPEP